MNFWINQWFKNEIPVEVEIIFHDGDLEYLRKQKTQLRKDDKGKDNGIQWVVITDNYHIPISIRRTVGSVLKADGTARRNYIDEPAVAVASCTYSHGEAKAIKIFFIKNENRLCSWLLNLAEFGEKEESVDPTVEDPAIKDLREVAEMFKKQIDYRVRIATTPEKAKEQAEKFDKILNEWYAEYKTLYEEE